MASYVNAISFAQRLFLEPSMCTTTSRIAAVTDMIHGDSGSTWYSEAEHTIPTASHRVLALPELLASILPYLSFNDILSNARAVTTFWRTVIDTDPHILWHTFRWAGPNEYLKFGSPPPPPPPPPAPAPETYKLSMDRNENPNISLGHKVLYGVDGNGSKVFVEYNTNTFWNIISKWEWHLYHHPIISEWPASMKGQRYYCTRNFPSIRIQCFKLEKFYMTRPALKRIVVHRNLRDEEPYRSGTIVTNEKGVTVQDILDGAGDYLRRNFSRDGILGIDPVTMWVEKKKDGVLEFHMDLVFCAI